MDGLVVPTDGRSADVSRLSVTSYGLSIIRALGEQRAKIPLSNFNRVQAALRDAGFNIRSERGKPSRLGSPPAPRVSASLISFVVNSRMDLSPMKGPDRMSAFESGP